MLQQGGGSCQEKSLNEGLNDPSLVHIQGISENTHLFQGFREGVAEELLRQGLIEWWDKWTGCQKKVIPLECFECEAEFYVPFRCDLRICPECNKRYAGLFRVRYLKAIKEMMKRKKGRNRLMFLTLTTKNTGQLPDSLEIKAHNKAIGKLIKKYFKGGVSVNEVKRTYLHSHCIVYGPYVPQRKLSEEWETLTGYQVVDIREIRGKSREVCNYLAKYLRKPSRFENSQTDCSLAVQFLKNFHGVRRVHSFGCFYGLKLEREKFVCPYCGSEQVFVNLGLFNEGLTVEKCRGSPRIPSYREIITGQEIQFSKERYYAEKAYS